MISLKIKLQNGETRHITSNLNFTQLKSLVKYMEQGTLPPYERIEIIQK